MNPFKMLDEAIKTVKAIGYQSTHPFTKPSKTGDKFDVPMSKVFNSVQEAKRFEERHKEYVRFRYHKTVFYDRILGLE